MEMFADILLDSYLLMPIFQSGLTPSFLFARSSLDIGHACGLLSQSDPVPIHYQTSPVLIKILG